jgi:hypothetical protein
MNTIENENEKAVNVKTKNIRIFLLRLFFVILGIITGFLVGCFTALYSYDKTYPGDHEPSVLTAMFMGGFFGALLGMFLVILIIKLYVKAKYGKR